MNQLKAPPRPILTSMLLLALAAAAGGLAYLEMGTSASAPADRRSGILALLLSLALGTSGPLGLRQPSARVLPTLQIAVGLILVILGGWFLASGANRFNGLFFLAGGALQLWLARVLVAQQASDAG